MGRRGPVPKTNEQRQRRNKESRLQEIVAIAPSPAAQPERNPDWSYTANMMWDAMAVSAQARFYQPTDWAVGYFLCNTVTAFEQAGSSNGQMVASILSGCSSLMFTEGERRRVGVQLVSGTEDQTDHASEVSSKWVAKFST